MDDAVLATPTANALWIDDHSIKDATAREKEDDDATLLKDKEDHAIHYTINNTYQDGLSKEKKRAVQQGLQP